ncbi:hypothetical protein CCP4SC76_6070004 [Gammaproteobacteria bacterium]
MKAGPQGISFAGCCLSPLLPDGCTKSGHRAPPCTLSAQAIGQKVLENLPKHRKSPGGIRNNAIGPDPAKIPGKVSFCLDIFLEIELWL